MLDRQLGPQGQLGQVDCFVIMPTEEHLLFFGVDVDIVVDVMRFCRQSIFIKEACQAR